MRQTSEQKKRARAEKKAAYAEYLQTPRWKSIRRKVLKSTKGICISANCKGKAVQVHHIRYPATLGKEQMDWLYPLCDKCHTKIHNLTKDGLPLRDATYAVVGIRKSSKLRKHALKKAERKRIESNRKSREQDSAEREMRQRKLEERKRAEPEYTKVAGRAFRKLNV